MTEAVGYTRLSDTSDASIERQKRHIREYANEYGFELREPILDDGERSSGFDAGREEFRRLWEMVTDDDVDIIILNDKRRLAREFRDINRFLLDCDEQGVEIHTVEDGELDIESPLDFSIELVQAAAEHEAKKKEIQRAVDATRERIENGCYQGRPPHGLQFADDKCHLEKSNRWGDVMLVFDMLGSDVSYRAIERETGFDAPTISRMKSRGRSWYEDKLAEYGVDA